MKILLVALNAKYIHSNLALHSLKAYTHKYEKTCAQSVSILELTINHSLEQMLKLIYKQKADVVAFSCYIWNIEMIKRITSELKKVQKEVKIWYGGPEVSYDGETYFKQAVTPDGIIVGEGEETFLELVRYYVIGQSELENIRGLLFKDSARSTPLKRDDKDFDQLILEVVKTEPRLALNLDDIPFPYEDMELFRNKIVYYESSRGCPFSCSYCLSSIDKRVRIRNSELVKQELKLFLEYKVPQVKFVDRTFNCNRAHTMEIWKFIKQEDNGITNFHFEISADLLNEEEINYLAGLRPGQVQFEIGVQSTNPDTVKAIHRTMDFTKVSENVNKIKAAKNIHQHLDLIAGLPYEGYQSFERSFQEVYKLRPDQLQLGFLKVLKGSLMEQDSKKYQIIYREDAPYEVLATHELSYGELLNLKGVCEMVEIYYNSGQFLYSIRYLEHYYTTPMQLYRELSDYYEEMGFADIAHTRIRRFEILLEFFVNKRLIDGETREDTKRLFAELLVFDMLLREGMKARPSFAPAFAEKLKGLYRSYQTDRRMLHIEQFSFDIIASAMSGKAVRKTNTILFDYQNRDLLSKCAKIIEIDVP